MTDENKSVFRALKKLHFILSLTTVQSLRKKEINSKLNIKHNINNNSAFFLGTTTYIYNIQGPFDVLKGR